MAQSFAAWLQNRFGVTLPQLLSSILTTAGARVTRGFANAATAATGYAKTTAGAQALLAADNFNDRDVLITVSVTEAFAAGNGAATSFDIGETSTTTKFKSGLNTGALGAQLVYVGTLSAGKALLVTATAATGTGTGAISITVVALPVVS